MKRTYIRKSDNVKAYLTEIKYKDGSKIYIINWDTICIDCREYKTLKGAEKFLANKGYEEI